jgi:GNAT superfamily N-acetyltransferase
LSETIHYELQYLDLMRRIWTEGDERVDRTGVGTRSLFGETMRFSLRDDAIPLLTTKRVYWKTALRELLWFLTGDTNIRPLVAQGVRIWTDWPLEKYRRATGEQIDAEAFEATEIEISSVFYCAESVLLAGYRGQGIGHRFFDLREAHAKALGFDRSAFCAVIRPANHPLKPKSYRPLDGFWQARGYRPLPGVVAKFGWKDLDAKEETFKPMQFWLKSGL